MTKRDFATEAALSRWLSSAAPKCLIAGVAGDDRRGSILSLQGGQVGEHFGVGPVLWADDLAVDAALAVDDIGFWIHGGAIRESDFFRRVAEGGEPDIVGLQEIVVGALIIVQANAQDRSAERTDALLQLIERRRFLDAGRAPGGPEIEDDDLAAKVRKPGGFSIEGELKVFFRISAQARLALTIVGIGEQGNKPGNEEHDQRRFEIPSQTLFMPL